MKTIAKFILLSSALIFSTDGFAQTSATYTPQCQSGFNLQHREINALNTLDAEIRLFVRKYYNVNSPKKKNGEPVNMREVNHWIDSLVYARRFVESTYNSNFPEGREVDYNPFLSSNINQICSLINDANIFIANN